MPQSTQPTQSPKDHAAEEVATPQVDDTVDLLPLEAGDRPAPEDESTIGTGTSMALGCIAGTVLLIIFGLLFLALSRLV